MAVLLLADRRLERDRLPRDAQHAPDLLGRQLHRAADLLGGRLASELLHQRARDAQQLVDRLHHVHRDADGARLVGDRPGDRLADPPRRVGRELVAALVLELLDRAHQADVPFLDQVEELQPAVQVALGDRHDEPQIGLDQLLLARRRRAPPAARMSSTIAQQRGRRAARRSRSRSRDVALRGARFVRHRSMRSRRARRSSASGGARACSCAQPRRRARQLVDHQRRPDAAPARDRRSAAASRSSSRARDHARGVRRPQPRRVSRRTLSRSPTIRRIRATCARKRARCGGIVLDRLGFLLAARPRTSSRSRISPARTRSPSPSTCCSADRRHERHAPSPAARRARCAWRSRPHPPGVSSVACAICRRYRRTGSAPRSGPRRLAAARPATRRLVVGLVLVLRARRRRLGIVEENEGFLGRVRHPPAGRCQRAPGRETSCVAGVVLTGGLLTCGISPSGARAAAAGPERRRRRRRALRRRAARRAGGRVRREAAALDGGDAVGENVLALLRVALIEQAARDAIAQLARQRSARRRDRPSAVGEQSLGRRAPARALELGDDAPTAGPARPRSGWAAISSTMTSSAPAARGRLDGAAGRRSARRRPRRAAAPRRRRWSARRVRRGRRTCRDRARADAGAGAPPRARPRRGVRPRRDPDRAPRAATPRSAARRSRAERAKALGAVRAHERVGILALGQEHAAPPQPGVDEHREAAGRGATAGSVAVEARDDPLA